MSATKPTASSDEGYTLGEDDSVDRVQEAGVNGNDAAEDGKAENKDDGYRARAYSTGHPGDDSLHSDSGYHSQDIVDKETDEPGMSLINANRKRVCKTSVEEDANISGSDDSSFLSQRQGDPSDKCHSSLPDSEYDPGGERGNVSQVPKPRSPKCNGLEAAAPDVAGRMTRAKKMRLEDVV